MKQNSPDVSFDCETTVKYHFCMLTIDDDEWSFPSIYDQDDELEIPQRRHRSRALSPVVLDEAAVLAQIAGASVMAEADAAVARLDEKIAMSGLADAFVERIATAEAEALARMLGWRGREGDSEIAFRYDAALDDEVDAWVRWARRVLAAPMVDVAATADPDEFAKRMRGSGWRRMTALDVADRCDIDAPSTRDTPAEPDQAECVWLQTWLGAARAFADFGPTARGAMSFQAWSGGGAGGTDGALTGVVAAMRMGGGAGLTALRFIPLGLAARRRRPFGRLHAAERLARWSACVSESCRAHGAEVDRLLSWRSAAHAAEPTKLGREIVDLLLRRRQVMSEDVAKTLGVTSQGANQRLRAMRDAALVKQVSEGRRFRRWAAP